MTEAIAVTPVLNGAQILSRMAGISQADLSSVQAGNQPIGQATGPAMDIVQGPAEAAVLLGIRPRQSPFTY